MEMETNAGYDGAAEVRAFDATKAGVKGLVDAGITRIPCFFIHPPDPIPAAPLSSSLIPVIDLGSDKGMEEIVAQVKRAAEEFGFFQVVDHGVPHDVMDDTMKGAMRFHEAAPEEKGFYTQDPERKVSYRCNFA